MISSSVMFTSYISSHSNDKNMNDDKTKKDKSHYVMKFPSKS